MGLSRTPTRHGHLTNISTRAVAPQYRFLRHGRSRTCPLVMRFYRCRFRHLGSPRLHHRQPTTAAHVPETPMKRRSDLGVPDTLSSPSKRWRSGTLYPETLVPTTASVTTDKASPTTASPSTAQRRWRAGGLRALRPLRRLGGKQADPSEVPSRTK